MMRPCPRSVLVLLLAAVAGCGGSAPRTPDHVEAPAPVLLADLELSARPPLLAVPTDDDRIVVLVGSRGADGDGLKAVVGRVTAEGWDTEVVRVLELTAARSGAVAGIADGAGILLAYGDAGGIHVTRLAMDGSRTAAGDIEGPPAQAMTLTRSADGVVHLHYVPEAEGEAPVYAARIGAAGADIEPAELALPARAEQRLAAVAMGSAVLVARASPKGLDLAMPDGTTQELATTPTHAVALLAAAGAPTLAWADASGVHLRAVGTGDLPAPRDIDLGDRVGEPAHRVGAALTLARDGEDIVAAYQDQVRGSLMSARVGQMVTRQEHGAAGVARGFSIALVRTDAALIAMDVGLRSGADESVAGGVEGVVRVERLR